MKPPPDAVGREPLAQKCVFPVVQRFAALAVVSVAQGPANAGSFHLRGTE